MVTVHNEFEIPLVLASGSATRRRLLDAAGLRFRAITPAVDEGAIKDLLAKKGAAAAAAAMTLAEAKARKVSADLPEALVIGADQILDASGTWFDKPDGRTTAARQLAHLRGRSHDLQTAVAVVQGDAVVWRHQTVARLRMRDFSDAFLESYLDQVGDAATASVGGYQIEGPGAQLFSAIEGDYFGILGLPLLPLLDYLRVRGVIAT
jgi:septum formation protein